MPESTQARKSGEVTEAQYIPVQHRTVFPADGRPAYIEYLVPGKGWMRWPQFIELRRQQKAGKP